MRMWMLPPQLMCKMHLVGEHGEYHKFRGVFEKQQAITGRIYPKAQIFPSLMKERHDLLAKEMLRRGINHRSPYTLPDLSYLDEKMLMPPIDYIWILSDLLTRCKDCQYRIKSMTGIDLNMLKRDPDLVLLKIRSIFLKNRNTPSYMKAILKEEDFWIKGKGNILCYKELNEEEIR